MASWKFVSVKCLMWVGKGPCVYILSMKLHTILMKKRQHGPWIQNNLPGFTATLCEFRSSKDMTRNQEWMQILLKSFANDVIKAKAQNELWLVNNAQDKILFGANQSLKIKRQKQMPWVNFSKLFKSSWPSFTLPRRMTLWMERIRTNRSIKIIEGQTV